MRLYEFEYSELTQWVPLGPSGTHWGDELIKLVQSAYSFTNLGSFVNTLNDVHRSDWLVLDWNNDSKYDCAIFYRNNRPDETWVGTKIQGVGHNQHPKSKKHVLHHLSAQLRKTGWWVESSGALATTLSRMGIAPVTDRAVLLALFPDSNLTLLDNSGKYTRELPNGTVIQEIVFGHPVLQ